MPHFGEPPFPIPRYQPAAIINIANPVSGTQYLILGAIPNARIIDAAIWCTWTVQPTPLELYTTKDGIPLRWSFANPATAVYYYPSGMDARNPDNNMALDVTRYGAYRAFLMEARNVGPWYAEITGGTVQSLQAIIKYSRY